MRQTDEEFRREIESHLELETDRLIVEGLSPFEARDQALRRFGNVTRTRERYNEAQRFQWWDDVRRDLRLGLRALARAPLFALTAVTSIALGIGLDTAVFTVAKDLLVQAPAGVLDPDRLIDISQGDDFGINEVAFGTYRVLANATTLIDVTAYKPFPEPMGVVFDQGAERAFGHQVTTSYFDVHGVGAAVGRLFDPSDSGAAEAPGVVVLSDRFWARRFGRDPSVINSMILLNKRPTQIIGIAAEGFTGTSLMAADFWWVLKPTAGDEVLAASGIGWALVRARLRPGATIGEAGAELETLTSLSDRTGRSPGDRRLRVTAASIIPGNLSQPLSAVLALLMAFVSLVLVAACVNLAGLLIARAPSRAREMAVRAAVGADRRRLVRQLLAETVVLFAIAALGGGLVVWALHAAIRAWLPLFPVPITLPLEIDVPVVMFVFGLTLVTALGCGLVPALRASRVDVVATLKRDGPGVTGRSRLHHAFVVCQITLSVVLVAGAAVFVKAVHSASTFDSGFDERDVTLAELDLALGGDRRASGDPFVRQVLARIRAIPGVEQASAAALLPTGGAVRLGHLAHVGGSDARSFLEASWNAVEPRYFSTLKIPLLAGRDFDEDDRHGLRPVIIVSETAARQYWPGQSAVGQRLWLYSTERGRSAEAVEVVGVVGDVRFYASRGSRPMVYVPLAQRHVTRVTLAARGATGVPITAAIRHAVAATDVNLPILTLQTLEEAAAVALLPRRLAAWVSAGLGVVAMFLAALGVYGVTAQMATRRLREFGVRVALGATRPTVMGIILKLGMTLVAAGTVLGLILAGSIGWGLASVLHGFPAPDAIALGTTTVVIALVGLVACIVPVRRALTANPVDVLRVE
jgi:predicted permease